MTCPPDDQEEENQEGTLMGLVGVIIAAIALFLLIIALIIIVIVRRRPRNNGEQRDVMHEVGGAPSGETDEHTTLALTSPVTAKTTDAQVSVALFDEKLIYYHIRFDELTLKYAVGL